MFAEKCLGSRGQNPYMQRGLGDLLTPLFFAEEMEM